MARYTNRDINASKDPRKAAPELLSMGRTWIVSNVLD